MNLGDRAGDIVVADVTVDCVVAEVNYLLWFLRGRRNSDGAAEIVNVGEC